MGWGGDLGVAGRGQRGRSGERLWPRGRWVGGGVGGVGAGLATRLTLPPEDSAYPAWHCKQAPLRAHRAQFLDLLAHEAADR